MVVGLTALLPWRREQRGQKPVEPAPSVEDDLQDQDVVEQPLVDPAAAVFGEEALDVGTAEKVDRRRARRDRRRQGRQGGSTPAGATDLQDEEPDLLPVDPAAAVALEDEIPVEQVVTGDGEEETIDEIPVDEPVLAPDADLSMHVVEVPADDPAEFVRDFLTDVQRMIHGGVPTSEQAEAAEARTREDWLPEEWVVDRKPLVKRRRGSDDPEVLPVVRPPKVSRRRRVAAPRRSVRLARSALVVVVLGGAAALPWVVPEVPDWFASAVPQDEPDPVRTGPTIIPAPTATGTPAPMPTPTPGQSASGLAAAGRPLEVWVPRLKVRSPVVAISGQSGTLLPPDDAQILGWWQEGRGAGAENGSAVVTGHTVSTGGGAFDNLQKLVTGDRLRVRTAAGWITYAVERSKVYSVEQLAENAEDIFDRDGESRLVLITCSDFNGEVYLSNAVVFATAVGDEPFVVPGNPDEEVPDGGLVRPWDDLEGNTGDDRGVQLTDKPF